MPAGRPSKYEPRFCDELREAMAEGYSATAFAGKIGVCRATIDNWAKENPEFLEALNDGKAVRLYAWERIGINVAKGGGGPGSASMVAFGLKNMGGDEWRDRQQHELMGEGGGAIQTESTVVILPANGREDGESV